jgi:alkylhydroperoxidase family enzyme
MKRQVSPEAQRLLEKIVPPPNRPPLLYLELAANTAVVRSFAEGPIAGLRGLMHTGQISSADRELCILRVTARKGAAHEWGVHVAYFGKKSGLSPSQVEATAASAVAPQPPWTERQSAIIAIADAVADCRALTPTENGHVGKCMSDAERAEFVVLASLYLGIAAMCAVFAVPVEPGTPQMPVAS